MMSRQGIKNIANRIHGLAAITATALRSAGFGVDPTPFFDTIKINVSTKGEEPGSQEPGIVYQAAGLLGHQVCHRSSRIIG